MTSGVAEAFEGLGWLVALGGQWDSPQGNQSVNVVGKTVIDSIGSASAIISFFVTLLVLIVVARIRTANFILDFPRREGKISSDLGEASSLKVNFQKCTLVDDRIVYNSLGFVFAITTEKQTYQLYATLSGKVGYY